MTESTWPGLRRQLEAAALIQAESLPDRTVPYLRFHPTLAPQLWWELCSSGSESERQELLDRYRRHYYALSRTVYADDNKKPIAARAVVTRELPNLLKAVRAALAAGDDQAGDFADNVNKFLRNFGRRAEADELTAAADRLSAPGSPGWFQARSNVGEQLYSARRLGEAIDVFREILETLGGTEELDQRMGIPASRPGSENGVAGVERSEPPAELSGPDSGRSLRSTPATQGSHATPVSPVGSENGETDKDVRPTELTDDQRYQRCATIARLGRCYQAGKQPGLAVACQRQALSEIDTLEQTDGVKRLQGTHLTDLADALAEQGEFAEARQAYEASLAIKREIGGEERGTGVVLGQLGTLAMREGDLPEAVRRFEQARELFRQLGEPQAEATAWHQLGICYQRARQWEAAERHHREAARLKEARGDLAAAATTYNQLANVCKADQRPEAAEEWYRKAVAAFRQTKQREYLAANLNNYADLLWKLPGRLAEARVLAEEALRIKQTLDPSAAQIWLTYNILSEICETEQAGSAGARRYRQLARQAKGNYAGTRYELRRPPACHVIALTVAVLRTGSVEAREALTQLQEQMRDAGGEWAAFAGAQDRLLADPAGWPPPVSAEDQAREGDLFDRLSFGTGPILVAIREGQHDLAAIEDLIPEDFPRELFGE